MIELLGAEPLWCTFRIDETGTTRRDAPMTALHEITDSSNRRTALDEVLAFVMERRRQRETITDMEAFEKEVHELFAAAECEFLAEELEALDVDVPLVMIDGVPHARAIRSEQTYFAACGPVRVNRTLYRDGRDGGRCLCPVELRAGIVEGFWTPLAAKQATWVVANMTPAEGERLFDRLGGMNPSKSSLDRLPKHLSARWEQGREQFEEALREQEQVPAEAVSMAVSLDGVMAPMKDGERREKRALAAANGKLTKGPAGYREVGCGTISFHDADGNRLSTLRMARMPERKKATLKEMLMDEVISALAQRPDLKIVKLADGARDNWTFLAGELPPGPDLVDFFHVAEHLNAALGAAYGEGTTECRARFEKLRIILRDDGRGAEKVIRALVYLRDKHPRRKKLQQELAYFRNNRHRMHYAAARKAGLPIGSGVVEAACKTLVTERMKRSGMRWRHDGGQAVLTFRAAEQSGRFDRAWQLLAPTYKAEVTVPENVVPLRRGAWE